MEQLEGLSSDLAMNVVMRFSEANLSRINSKNGFLSGIIRRIQQDGGDMGPGDFSILPRAVRHRVEDLIDRGRLRRSDIDKRMTQALAELSSDDGLAVVDKYSSSDLSIVRSKTGFFMGIIKRMQAESRYRSSDRYGDRYDRYGGGGYDRYDRRYR